MTRTRGVKPGCNLGYHHPSWAASGAAYSDKLQEKSALTGRRFRRAWFSRHVDWGFVGREAGRASVRVEGWPAIDITSCGVLDQQVGEIGRLDQEGEYLLQLPQAIKPII